MIDNSIQKTTKYLRNKSTYVGLVIAFVIMIVIFPKEGKFKYEYQVGRPWLYETLIAPLDFPILKTDQELLNERNALAQRVVPYYLYDYSIPITQQEEIAKQLLKAKISSEVCLVVEQSLMRIYNKGIINSKSSGVTKGGDVYKVNYLIVQRDSRAKEELESTFYTPAQALRLIKQDLESSDNNFNTDSLLSAISLKDLIIPNLLFDQQNTQLAHKKAVDYISPTKGIIYTGQLIVSEGETITGDVLQLLDSYKAEYIQNIGYTGTSFQLVLGHAIFLLLVLFLFYVTIYFVQIELFDNRKQYSFILSMLLMMFILMVVVVKVDVSYLYMIPYAVFALYMMAFFSAKLVFPIYMIALMPLLIIAENGIEIYTINVFAGGIALVSFTYLNRGWLQFLNSMIIFIGISIGFFAFRLMEGASFSEINYSLVLYIFLNALFVVAAYPLVFLLEKMFSLVSGSTLRDLSDTNNKLIQELARLAPGTFQHSLQVANMAERAVRAIRGNTRLAKVGAMYHDVGKIANPQGFIENQAPGINYHNDLSPIESARVIIKHVEDGVELATKYNLPQIIIDFITSHHGHSKTMYFYTKYCNEGGDPKDIGEFTYSGSLPTTKEHVVVMIADAVEAASRTLKDYSAESISNLVENIAAQRVFDTELQNADISIKEINIVKTVFKKHLQEIYHARIAYPAKKKDTRRTVKVTSDTE